MLRKRIWILLLIVLPPAMGCGLFYGRKIAKQEPIKIYKVPVEVDREETPKPPPPGETAESGHWHGDEWHAEPHEAHAPAEVSEQPQTLVEPTERDAVVSETQPPADFVNPTSKSSNPLFADGVPEHLQCPPEFVGFRPDPDDGLEGLDEKTYRKLETFLDRLIEEIPEKWNPNRPLSEIWTQMIERRKRLESATEATIDMVVQHALDFPEILVLMEEDTPRAMNMLRVELGKKAPDWNVKVLHDGRIFRMKANFKYQFRFTEVMDVEKGLREIKSYDLAPLIDPFDLTWETVIIHLDHVTDEALQRSSGWDYTINPYTTGAYKLGDNKSREKNMQKTDANARVSPFGFGPYPKVPDDFPTTPSWLNPNSRNHDDFPRSDELSYRCWIKLWNQGDKNVTNFLMTGGSFYPIYPNTVYVEYHQRERSDGSTERRPHIVTYGQVSDDAAALLRQEIIPPDVCVVSIPSNVVIDPYEYLQLK